MSIRQLMIGANYTNIVPYPADENLNCHHGLPQKFHEKPPTLNIFPINLGPDESQKDETVSILSHFSQIRQSPN